LVFCIKKKLQKSSKSRAATTSLHAASTSRELPTLPTVPRHVVSHFNFLSAQVMLPVIGSKDVVVWDHKRDLDLSDTLSLPFTQISFFAF